MSSTGFGCAKCPAFRISAQDVRDHQIRRAALGSNGFEYLICWHRHALLSGRGCLSMSIFAYCRRTIAACLGLVLASLYNTASTADTTLTLSQWWQTASFVGPRTSHSAVIVNNRIYVLGGLTSTPMDFTLYDEVQSAAIGNDGSTAPGGMARHDPAACGALRSGDSSIEWSYLCGGRLCDLTPVCHPAITRVLG
jgi:hypothetical protein